MARVAGLKTKLLKYNVDEEIAKAIIGSGDLVDIIGRMETLLDPETVCQILDASACGTSKKELGDLKKIEAESLEKKIDAIAHLGDFHSDWDVCLNCDNTLAGGWTLRANDTFACVCSAAVNRKTKVSDLVGENRSMPLTYCLCCAGHCRQHLQKLLNLQLKTREVASSPINSKGRKPCRFVFEII